MTLAITSSRVTNSPMHHQSGGPAFGEGQGGHDRQHGGQIGADIRQVSQHGSEKTPEQGVLDAQGEQPEAQHEAERAVDERLHEQKTADSLARLVDELGGRCDAPVAHQPDHAVAKFLAPLQHEDDQDDRQGKLSQDTPSSGSRSW